MNCDGVNEWLSDGAPHGAAGEAAREHIAGCRQCQELWEILAQPLPEPEKARPGPPPLWEAGAGVAGTAAAAIGLAIAIRGGPGWAALGAEERLALSAYALLLLGLLTVSLWRFRRPAGIQPIAPGWLLGGVWVGYPLLAGALFSSRPVEGIEENGWICLSIGLSVALGTGGVLWGLAQRGFRAERVWLGAVIGAVGGLVGVMALQVICPDQHAEHVAVWHGLTGSVSVAAGAVTGWLAWRRAAC